MQNVLYNLIQQSFFKEDILLCCSSVNTEVALQSHSGSPEFSKMGASEVHCYNNCGCYSGIPFIIFYQFLEDFVFKTGIGFVAQYLPVGSVSSRSLYFSWLDVTVAQSFIHSIFVVLMWMTLKSLSSLQFTTEQLVRHTVAFHSYNVSQMSNHVVKWVSYLQGFNEIGAPTYAGGRFPKSLSITDYSYSIHDDHLK